MQIKYHKGTTGVESSQGGAAKRTDGAEQRRQGPDCQQASSNGAGNQSSDLLHQITAAPGPDSSRGALSDLGQQLALCWRVPRQLRNVSHHHCLQSAHMRVENGAVKSK